MRPVVDSADRCYEMVMRRSHPAASVVIDGRLVHQLHDDDRVAIQRANASFQMIEVGGHTYYRTLREKLGWGGADEGIARRSGPHLDKSTCRPRARVALDSASSTGVSIGVGWSFTHSLAQRACIDFRHRMNTSTLRKRVSLRARRASKCGGLRLDPVWRHRVCVLRWIVRPPPVCRSESVGHFTHSLAQRACIDFRHRMNTSTLRKRVSLRARRASKCGGLRLDPVWRHRVCVLRWIVRPPPVCRSELVGHSHTRLRNVLVLIFGTE